MYMDLCKEARHEASIESVECNRNVSSPFGNSDFPILDELDDGKVNMSKQIKAACYCVLAFILGCLAISFIA